MTFLPDAARPLAAIILGATLIVVGQIFLHLDAAARRRVAIPRRRARPEHEVGNRD